MIRAVQAQAMRDHARSQSRAGWMSGPAGGSRLRRGVQVALDQTIAVNQAEFDATPPPCCRAPRLITPVTAAALALVALLSLGGVWLRLREYR